ncbi:MAG: DegT/DnrJ/EryC1/StrS family aminotransferase [Desulfovibrionaceae bacterium]
MPIRSKERFLVFGSPLIEQAEMDEVQDCLRSGWLGTGPKVARFEREFAAYAGAEHAAAFNSCTAALHMALVALDLRPGDEVITTPLTFCATVNAIIHAGGAPVLADVDPRTLNIDPEAVRRAITPRTRAILPVHFAGRSCDMDALMALAAEHGLKVVEDCAHAIETTWRGRHAGTFGDFGCFSFYVTKNVVTGEGGMVLAKRREDLDRIKILGLHGMSADAWKRFSDEGYKHYLVVGAGFKYNMMDIQAAIGIHQLARVERNHAVREAHWARYDELLAGLPLALPAPDDPRGRHARHLYTVLVDEAAAGVTRDEVLTRMTREGIGVGVHYLSLPEHPFYQERFGWRPEDWPAAMDIGRRTMSLPLSAKLTEADVRDVARALALSLGAA